MKKNIKVTNSFLFLKYAMAGIFNTFVDLSAFFVICDLMGFNEIASNAAAYVCSATSSYLINSRYVYKEFSYTYKRYFQFLFGNLSVFLISSSVIFFVSDFVELKLIAKIIALPVVIVLNFGFQRYLLFRSCADRQLVK